MENVPPATSRHAYTKKMSYSKWLNFNLLPKKDQGQSFYQVLRPQIESILAKGRMWEKSSTTRIGNRGVVLCIPVARWDAVMKISALLQWFWTLRHGLAVVKCGNAHLVWDNCSSDPFCVHILCPEVASYIRAEQGLGLPSTCHGGISAWDRATVALSAEELNLAVHAEVPRIIFPPLGTESRQADSMSSLWLSTLPDPKQN